MKKILFATTALVATAGVAAADVTFGGYGRFGVQYDSDVRQAGVDGILNTADDVFDSEINVTSRFRLQIDATAESDAGVTFGARVRIQQNEGQTGRTNGARFFARSGGFEVGVGNIFGALEFMPGMYPIDMGLTGLGYDYTAYQFNADAYSSGGLGSSGSNGIEFLYSAGDFSAHVSASDTSDRIAAHAAYTFSGWTFALGAQDSDNAGDTELAASVGGSFGFADVTLAYADNGTNGDVVVLTGRFDVGAATNIEVYVTDHELASDTGYGVDFNHDLGGGTSLRGGIVKRVNGDTRADMGVRFNF
jgi:outer membrane protein OmpU